ncbi:hypothetical protein GE09DRAFT_618554 [Coniochaeta sp. 2T2.1]|nr:hypothetical protein GE09DRAFT_618554 [Coniochaeta sp. 2T2.1]
MAEHADDMDMDLNDWEHRSNAGSDDGSDAGSDASSNSSGTTSSSEDEEKVDIDWDAIGVDYLTTKAALKALGERKPMPRPPTTSAPLRPPPKRKEFDGVKKYVEWVPYWCDPAWNDQHYIFEEDGVPKEWVEVHPLDKQRPALLPQDAHKNPTPYAKRFGIHSNRTDGRSRMSPTLSATRRVQLSHVYDTPTGRKDYINVKDVRTFLPDADPRDISGYLNSLLYTKPDEQIEAFLQLQDLLEQDDALQQVAFSNVTTDERLAHDIHSIDPSPVKYDLQGPLHPLVDRPRWLDTLDRGDEEEAPRYLYNLDGVRGEWCAQDDHVWMAIQPALQVVTRILNTDHPYWLALLDAKSRKPLDPERIRAPNGFQSDWLYFTTSANAGSEHIRTLESLGYNLTAAVAEFMKHRLWIDIGSSSPKWKKGTPIDSRTWGWQQRVWVEDPGSAGMHINVSADALYPLLLSDISLKEKASCTMVLAATLLHELAHAANAAVSILTGLARSDCHDASSPLFGVSDEGMEALRQIWNEIHSDHEPYFEQEPRNECGHSFENQLFGGSVESAFGGNRLLYRHYQLTPLGLAMREWPHRSTHHDERILLDAALPVEDLMTLLPTDRFTKFYDQSFWDVHFAKYGHQTLKLAGTLTGLQRDFMRKKDLRRVFGKSHGEWLRLCLTQLMKLGHGLLHSYCKDLVLERMEYVWVRKRFHHESRLWATRTEAFDKIVNRLVAQSDKVYDAKKLLKGGSAKMRGVGISPEALDISACAAKLSREFALFIIIFLEVHHHLLYEIRCTQVLVVDYIQQPQAARQRLHRHYCGSLYTRIEEMIEPVAQHLVQWLQRIRQEMSGLVSVDIIDDAGRIQNHLRLDLEHLAKTKFYLSDDNVFVDDLMWTGELETIPRGRNKKKSQTLKRMATKELVRAGEMIRKLVDTFLQIIEMNSGEAKEEEDARALERVTERLQRELQTNPQRLARAAGDPRWQHPAASTGRPVGATAAGTAPPWTIDRTPTPSAAERGLVFGRPNSITPDGTPPITPTTSAFSQYHSNTVGLVTSKANQCCANNRGLPTLTFRLAMKDSAAFHMCKRGCDRSGRLGATAGRRRRSCAARGLPRRG